MSFPLYRGFGTSELLPPYISSGTYSFIFLHISPPPYNRLWDLGKFRTLSPPLYELWDLEKFQAHFPFIFRHIPPYSLSKEVSGLRKKDSRPSPGNRNMFHVHIVR